LKKYHNLNIPEKNWLFVSLPYSVGCKACSKSILNNLNTKELSSNITFIVSSEFAEYDTYSEASIIYDSLGIIERLPINTNNNCIIFCSKNKVDSILTFDARNYKYAESTIFNIN
jgi:hypothetical protein